MTLAHLRSNPLRVFMASVVFLMSFSSLGAETRYWMENLNKRPYAVGASDGVTVAVALRATTVISVEDFAFNDTTSESMDGSFPGA